MKRLLLALGLTLAVGAAPATATGQSAFEPVAFTASRDTNPSARHHPTIQRVWAGLGMAFTPGLGGVITDVCAATTAAGIAPLLSSALALRICD